MVGVIAAIYILSGSKEKPLVRDPSLSPPGFLEQYPALWVLKMKCTQLKQTFKIYLNVVIKKILYYKIFYIKIMNYYKNNKII